MWPGRVHQGLICFLMMFTILYFLFPDGIPPDGTPVMVIESLHISFIITSSILTTVCVMLSLSGCVFMFVFRDRKWVSIIFCCSRCIQHSIVTIYRVVKLTSPNLNYLIVAGTILLSLAMLQYSVPTKNPILITALCWVRMCNNNNTDNNACMYTGKSVLCQHWTWSVLCCRSSENMASLLYL